MDSVSDGYLRGLLLSRRVIRQGGRSPLVSARLESPGIQRFLCSVLFLLLVTKCIIHARLLFISQTCDRLRARFREFGSLVVPSCVVRLQGLLSECPPSRLGSF